MLLPKSKIVNSFLSFVVLLPLPTICKNKGSDLVALYKITTSILASSKPAVSIPTFESRALGVSLNHFKISFLSVEGVFPSICLIGSPLILNSSTNFLLAEILGENTIAFLFGVSLW